MAYRLQGKDIVISGFEGGIADSPYKGIADMRNVNIISNQGEAAVNFKTSAMTMPPTVSAAAFTASASTDLITWANSQTLYNGAAIILNTNSAGGITTGTVYYVGNYTGTTFKLYSTVFGGVNGLSPIDITVNGSGTFTTYTMGNPMHWCLDQGQTFSTTQNGIPSIATYLIDSKNQVWLLIPISGISTFPAGRPLFMGNIGSTTFSGDNNICVWNNYLFVFRFGATDYWNMSLFTDPATAWHYNWWGQPAGTAVGSLRSIVAQDDAIYICNGSNVASILENAGTSFDPTNAATYTRNSAALALPTGEQATALAELGTNLMVGGIRSYIYPWDRVSTSYSYPLVMPERYIGLIVSTNSITYVFAGNRGRIYITNSSNIDLLKKIPDYLSGTIQPYYLTGGVGSVLGINALGDALYWKNQIYFSFVSTNNAGTTLTNTTGIWAIDIDTNALRMTNKMSYGNYGGTITCIAPDMSSVTPNGEGLYAGWIDGSGNVGIDNSVATPYNNSETIIETELIPVGTFIDPFSPTQVEWKTSVPLGSNGTSETISMYFRTNLSDSFVLIGTSTITTAPTADFPNVSDYFIADFQKAQWIQLRIVMSSNSTNPTYNRLTEVRIRDYPNGAQS